MLPAVSDGERAKSGQGICTNVSSHTDLCVARALASEQATVACRPVGASTGADRAQSSPNKPKLFLRGMRHCKLSHRDCGVSLDEIGTEAARRVRDIRFGRSVACYRQVVQFTTAPLNELGINWTKP